MSDIHALWSRSETDRPGTPLLVLLHGYGSDAADLFSLVPVLPERFTVVSLQAPLSLAGVGMGGYAWFSLERERMSFPVAEVTTAIDQVTNWIQQHAAPHSSVSLLGFSQGMCMASSLLRCRPEDYAAVVGLSGFILTAAELEAQFQDQRLAQIRPPFFFGRADVDPIIPEPLTRATDSWLPQYTEVETRIYPGIGHSINAAEIQQVNRFLERVVPAA